MLDDLHWADQSTTLLLAYLAGAQIDTAVTIIGAYRPDDLRYDHPLTSTALLELGKLALKAGEFAPAARYFEEATYASLAFTNPTNLEEGFRYGALAHLLQNQKGPYPLLAPAMHRSGRRNTTDSWCASNQDFRPPTRSPTRRRQLSRTRSSASSG